MNVNWVVIERLKSMAVSGCDQTGWLDMDALARFSHEGFASLVVLDVLREQRDVLQDVVGTALVAGRQPCYACVLRELRAKRPDLDDEQRLDRSAYAQQERKRAVNGCHRSRRQR